MDYCNIIVYGDSKVDKTEFIKMLMTDERDIVLPNWFAKLQMIDSQTIKVNVWEIDSNQKRNEGVSALEQNTVLQQFQKRSEGFSALGRNALLQHFQKPHTILLIANLSDPQVIEKLTPMYNSLENKQSIIVIGLYKQQSCLTETFKLKVLEWSAQQSDDLPFIEVNLAESQIDNWMEIIRYAVTKE